MIQRLKTWLLVPILLPFLLIMALFFWYATLGFRVPKGPPDQT